MKNRPYHHGDLRRTIVYAAVELLKETQSTDFSLRELARRAGVSHNAPYKHFAEKRELLAAVSAAGFDTLAKRMGKAGTGLTEPSARLSAMVRAYIRHGVENPALYRLMFGGYLGDSVEGRPAVERTAAEKTRMLIVSAIVDGALGEPVLNVARNERKIAGTLLTYWSVLHGLTLLLADGLVGPKSKCEELGESIVGGIVEGLAMKLPALPPGTWVGPQG